MVKLHLVFDYPILVAPIYLLNVNFHFPRFISTTDSSVKKQEYGVILYIVGYIDQQISCMNV